jgi:hypothetical protein
MKKFLVVLLTLAMVLVFPLYALAEAVAPAVAPPIDLTPLLQAVIAVAAVLITSYVIPWLSRKKMMDYAKIAVYAAEKLLGPQLGPDKLVMVKDWMLKWGFDVDTEKVQAAIEAAVQQLSMEQAKPPNATKV